LALADTRYSLICNDDIIFRDPDCIAKTEAKHKEGYKIVHATENWSATSVDKAIINTVGWFDEDFWHSWEDIDYRFRMAHQSERMFRFDPWLIRHLRCQKGRNENYWDESAKHFFDKWGVTEYVQKKWHTWVETPETRKQLLCNQFFDHGIEHELKEVIPTPDYYPRLSKEYAEKYPATVPCRENT
jgi:GT2 family glycosyltransferase